MPGPASVPWPTSTNPGAAPGEGSGRLVNCYAYKDGDALRWKPAPGLDSFATVSGEVRGWISTLGVVVAVIGTSVVTIDASGNVSFYEGSVAGSGPVTITRNNALPPITCVVSNVSKYVIVDGVVSSYPDPDLPTVNDVAALDGYFLFTDSVGKIRASELNSDGFNPLSISTAEARPDTLIRGVAYGQQYFAMGSETIEVYQDVGASPFPFSRSTVIPIGLLGKWAVSGFEDGWGGQLIFVASDNTVRALNGYTPVKISTPDLERLIERVTVKTDLRASVYTFGGNSIFCLSSPDWTWECNVTSGFAWHERESYGQARWRGAMTVKAFGKWLVADRAGDAVYAIAAEGRVEGSSHLVWGMDSGPVKSFPNRVAVANASFDFVLGEASIDETPQAMLSWSHDGGRFWHGPLTRGTGVQGYSRGKVRIDRLGLSTPQGVRLRFRVSDTAYTSFSGASVEANGRK